MKRFYKVVSTRAAQDGWVVELDGKPVKTPSGTVLHAPTAALADLAAAEWAAQTDQIFPDSMPVTQILVTGLDRIAKDRAAMEAPVLAYLDTDLLCYRASEPPELVDREQAARDPGLAWFEKRFGVALPVTNGLAALRQPQDAHVKVRDAVTSMPLWPFNILQLVTGLTGSLVLGLAFVEGACTADDCLKALYVEEDHKADIYDEEFYGRAPQTNASIASAKRDLDAAQAFLKAL
jgi:chaperone required for assembly of F1-ATPase